MLYLALVTSLLAQTEAPASEVSAAASAERAAASAERAALAAEKAALAVQRLAELQAGVAVSPAAPATDEPKVDPWKGLIGIGLIWLSGNAETLTATMNAQVDKKLGNWAFGARASGAYGQARVPEGTQAQVTALRAALLLRGDRQISSFASIFTLGGLETDHVKSMELRGFAELGTGIKFYELKEGDLERVYLRGDVGFRYSHETRFEYFGTPLVPAGTGLASATMVGPRIGAVFRYAVSKEIRFSEEAEFLPNLVGPPRYLVNSATKLNARLSDSLSMSAAFLLAYDSLPAAGKKTTDTALMLGLEAAF